MCDFQVYTGKVGDTTEKNLGARVVKDLSEHIKGKNYLYIDNFILVPNSKPSCWITKSIA